MSLDDVPDRAMIDEFERRGWRFTEVKIRPSSNGSADARLCRQLQHSTQIPWPEEEASR